MKKPPAAPKVLREQVIRTGEIYTLPEFRARTGWGQAALRTARRAGLRVIRSGGRGFIKGADFFEYLDSLESE